MHQLQSQRTQYQTTAHLAQTMTLLAMSVLELGEEINHAIASNPALEIIEERRCPHCKRLLQANQICPVCSQPYGELAKEVVVFISPRKMELGLTDSMDDYGEETTLWASVTLAEHVLRQIGSELNDQEKYVAAFLLNQLNEDGFLEDEIANIAQFLHVLPSQIEDVRRIIQKADPIGVASYNPQEALLAQIKALAENTFVPELTTEIIKNDYELFFKKQFKEIEKKYEVNVDEILKIVNFISENLNPFPGRANWGNEYERSSNEQLTYTKPDIIISQLDYAPDSPLRVELLMPVYGTLQVNKLYKKELKNADEESKEKLKEDLEKAVLFIKCIDQRNNTMVKLLERIVTIQNKFILNGDKFLKPMTRAELSQELEVHESTISRAVANKTVQLPNRHIIPLSTFFDKSLAIRTEIKEIISKEQDPLSDSKVMRILEKKGFKIARRTVAKYRSMEGILPAHLRKSDH